MLKYKIDVIEELKKKGINTTVARKDFLFSQDIMKKFKDKNTNITLKNLNKLCCILNLKPCDIIEYVESNEDKEILKKINTSE